MPISNACGMGIKGFSTGDWAMPEGMDMSDIPPEEMLPSADKMATADSVVEVRELLAAGKKTALETLMGCTEERLNNEFAPAP